MSGFDRLGRELESAAERERETQWARRRRSAGGAAVIVAGLATVVVVAVVAVALLHSHAASSPTGSSTPAGSPAQPAPAAQAAAWARLLRCPGQRHGNKLAKSTIISGAAPDPELVAALGVLRAPWTAADAPPAGTTCKSVSALFTVQRLDFRYVRYVGPGLRGGEVFLVPGSLTFSVQRATLPRRTKKNIPLPHGSQFSTACVFTVGASATTSTPTLGGCQLLEQIDRPASKMFALTTPPPIPVSVRRVACTRAEPAASRAKCLATPPTIGFPALHQVFSGVVRDGIVSLDVYARVKGVRKLVLDAPVHNNVYSFQTGGAVNGVLSLVFKDASGQTVQTTPSYTGTSNSVVVTTTAITGTIVAKPVTTPTPVFPPKPTRTVTGTAIPLP
jgi:hypothetical protein